MIKFIVFFLSFTALNAGIHQEGSKDFLLDTSQTHILEIARSLPQKGTLTRKSNGYVYLDISNEYVTKIFPNMILDGHLRPTDSFTASEGAHISVISELENCPSIEAEIGREFNFQIKELRKVPSIKTGFSYGNSFSYKTGDRWMLAIESEELENLRMKNGLTPLMNGHDFHISIGFEVPFERINNFGTTPTQK